MTFARRVIVTSVLTIMVPAVMGIATKGVYASMLTLPTAESLSGQWQVSASEGDAVDCLLGLSSQPGSNPNNRDYVLQVPEVNDHCAAIKKAVGWRPTPDGITLTDKNGSMVVFFSRRAEGHYVSSRSQLELTRQHTVSQGLNH